MRGILLVINTSNRRPGGAAALLAMLCAGLVPFATDAAAAKLRIGTSGDYPPYSEAVDEAPVPYQGFDIALALAYARDRGHRIEFVRFRWSKLRDDLASKKFDIAMSGVTVRPLRSVVGRFTVPLLETGAVVLTRAVERFESIHDLDRRKTRIGVNAGGHLEQVAREHFHSATLVFIRENSAVLEALVGYTIDAAVTDSIEAPLWQAADPELGVIGPFTRDRKAYLVRADRPELARDLDQWLLQREADGTLGKLRRQYFGPLKDRAPTTALVALVAALDERLSLMPWVVAAKREHGLPITSRRREKVVLATAMTDIRAAEEQAGRAAWPEPGVRALFEAQISAAKQVQLAAGRDPEFEPETPLPQLDRALRPAILRIGDRISWLLTELPDDLDPLWVKKTVRRGLRSRDLSPTSVNGIADALSDLVKAGREQPAAQGHAAGPSANEAPSQQSGEDGQNEAGGESHQREPPAQDGNLPGDQPVDGQ